MKRFTAYLFAPLALLAGSLVADDAAVAEPDAKAAAPTAEIAVFEDGKLVVPAAFKKAEAKSRIIQHEFAAKSMVNGEEASARVTMMPAGGGVQANLDRWKGQFSGDNKKAGEAELNDSGKWKVHVLEVSGQYAENMGGGPFFRGKTVVRENYAMLGAILVHPSERKYFVKMIGPKEIIDENKDAFKSMVNSVGK